MSAQLNSSVCRCARESPTYAVWPVNDHGRPLHTYAYVPTIPDLPTSPEPASRAIPSERGLVGWLVGASQSVSLESRSQSVDGTLRMDLEFSARTADQAQSNEQCAREFGTRDGGRGWGRGFQLYGGRRFAFEMRRWDARALSFVCLSYSFSSRACASAYGDWCALVRQRCVCTAVSCMGIWPSMLLLQHATPTVDALAQSPMLHSRQINQDHAPSFHTLQDRVRDTWSHNGTAPTRASTSS